jgi:flagellar biosynthetic protein FliP
MSHRHCVCTPTGGGQFAMSLQLLIILTVLSVVPAILLMATSFTRIVVVLSLLRSAIGIPQLPPNQVLLGLALFLTLFIMGPTWSRINTNALQPYLAGTLPAEQALEAGAKPLREFAARTQSRSRGVPPASPPRRRPPPFQTEALLRHSS